MSRPLRIEYPGALYHVTSRGNGKKDIFLSDQDRQQFLFILAETIKKHNWLCHVYVLMDNHYHLVIETVDPTLSKGMQQLNGVFTQWFNDQHTTVGHIFQGRFKAFLVEEQSYFLNVARYVVLNPVRAKMVNNPARYAWSSYRATAGIEPAPPWLTTRKVIEPFDKKKALARKCYQEFVLAGIGLTSPFDQVRGVILGSDQFIDEHRDLLGLKGEEKEITITSRYDGRPTLKEIFEEVKNKKERNMGIKLAIGRLQYSGGEVGRFLKLDSSTVRKIAIQKS